MATTSKAASTSTPETTPTPKVVGAVRVAHGAPLALAKSTVGKVASQAKRDGHGDALALALRALLRQSYRPAGGTVLWAQPEHRTAHGDATPDNGASMADMATYVGAVLAGLPAAAKGDGDDRKAAKAAVAALAKALA